LHHSELNEELEAPGSGGFTTYVLDSYRPEKKKHFVGESGYKATVPDEELEPKKGVFQSFWQFFLCGCNP